MALAEATNWFLATGLLVLAVAVLHRLHRPEVDLAIADAASSTCCWRLFGSCSRWQASSTSPAAMSTLA